MIRHARKALILVLAACGGGTVTDSTPPVVPPDTTTHGGTVQRATLTVHVTFDAADAALAAAAGISNAGLTVRLTHDASNDPTRTAVTGADGVARFDSLLPGVYQASADRTLTSAELARLPADNQDASIFAAGGTVSVAAPLRDLTIGLVAASRGSLVISELYTYTSPTSGNGHYMEVFNNADTTVYLDGIVVFVADASVQDVICDTFAAQRLDPTGLWARIMFKFPGSGHSYPVSPGSAAVIATDAVDHRPGSANLQDLSRADFEMIGDGSDPNNPFSADMVDIKGSAALHGFAFGGDLLGLALPTARDTLQLERIVLQFNGNTPHSSFKIPRAALLDVAAVVPTPELDAVLQQMFGRSSWCKPFTLDIYDRAPAQLGDSFLTSAVARKALGHTAAGAWILQRTRTAARDFEYALPLRRSLLRP